MTASLIRVGLAALSTLAIVSPALAHMSFTTPQSAVGATYKGVLALPHGCDGAATDTVRVSIPDGFYNAQPMPKPGWTLEVTLGAYDTPFDDHGTLKSEGVREIVWSGGSVEDLWYDEFVFRGTFGSHLEPGEVIFPVEQGCGDAVVDWTPAVTLAGAGADPHGHGVVTAGDLTITSGFTRATLPNAPVGGGYVTIANGGAGDDRLVAASSPAAGEVQIHEMTVVDDVMEMRELEDGLAIPAGESVTLAPGGLHLMFLDLAGPFVEGEQVPVTLVFEKAGEVEVTLEVLGFGASGPAGDHSAHAGH